MLRGGATPDELRTLGITFLTTSVAAIVAVPTSAGFLVLNIAPAVAGVALLLGAQRAGRPAASPA